MNEEAVKVYEDPFTIVYLHDSLVDPTIADSKKYLLAFVEKYQDHRNPCGVNYLTPEDLEQITKRVKEEREKGEKENGRRTNHHKANCPA